jgi:hypothetical protein
MQIIHYNVSNFAKIMKRFNFKRTLTYPIGILGILVLSLGGCTTAAPVLNPDPSRMSHDGSADLLAHQLKVSIRPVVTTGFRSEDRKQFGVDLSAYFTAFYVEVQNGLTREVFVDASKIFIQDANQPPLRALNETESIEYYRQGDQPQPVLTIVPKSWKLEKQEIAKIRDLHFKSATLPPGTQHRGVVYFKKILNHHCQGVLFSMTGVQVEGEEFPREFQFGFNCGG